MSGENPALKIYLLGAPRAVLHGQPVGLHRSKALALLAFLCAEPVSHSRDQVIDLLWPSFEPDDARNNLRRELSLLKKSLDLDVLLVDRSNIGLNPQAIDEGSVEVDVLRFEGLVAFAAGHEEEKGQFCPECAEALATAAEIYTSDFLTGFTLPDSPVFDEWQFFQNDRLRRSAASVLDRLVDWHRQRDEFDPAINYARRRLVIDPLHEPSHRQLMTLYALSDQQSAALRQFASLKQLLADELGLEPEPETIELFEAIHKRQFSPQTKPKALTEILIQPNEAKRLDQNVSQIANNLPADTTPFIGRKKEIDQLVGWLNDRNIRVVTIMGVGGMGKTRLALATARHFSLNGDHTVPFPDGVFFIPLAPITRPEDIAGAIALALCLTPGSEEHQLQPVIDYLHHRHALLLLDNFEHLIEPRSLDTVQRILTNTAHVRMLITSRSKLGISGEQSFLLDGLTVAPDEASGSVTAGTLDPADVPIGNTENSAIDLFVAAGRRVEPAFRLTPENWAEVVRICQLVQGMPLGIELAAGWLSLLHPGEILKEIERNLDFLEGDWAGKPDRQASLKSVFKSSWNLLSEPEKLALAQLSVFPGSFTREAAEQVSGASLRTLLSLTNKSWLNNVSPNRYQIHELLRQYAHQELAAYPDSAEDLSKRHALFYASVLKNILPAIKGPQPNVAFLSISAELDNLRIAFEWLVENDDITTITTCMMPALFHYLESKYHFFLFHPLIESALVKAEALGLSTERAILLIARVAFFITGFPTRFIDYPWVDVSQLGVEDAQVILSEDPEEAGFWAILQAWQYGRLSDAGAGVMYLEYLLNWFTINNRPWEAAFARQSLGRLLVRRIGDVDSIDDQGQGRDYLLRSLHEFESLGDKREAAISQYFLGLERQRAGDLLEATRIIMQAQVKLRELGDDIIAANGYWQLADIHMQLGEVEIALDFLHKLGTFLIQRGRAQLAGLAISRQSYEAVRYGDLDEAMRLRMISLEISQRYEDDFLKAWDFWEMGEIFRVKGNLHEARNSYEKARNYFTVVNAPIGFTFYFRGLGDLALAEKDYSGSEDHFLTSVDWAQLVQHPWQETYALAGAGKAATGAGKFGQARAYFIRALQSTQNLIELDGMVLSLLAGVAYLYQQLNLEDRSRSLARLILSNPLTWRETQHNLVGIFGLEETQPGSKRLFDLGVVVTETLSELEQYRLEFEDKIG
jgi:predicted ATPase/DNA-binding SARP family transcriptional activator